MGNMRQPGMQCSAHSLSGGVAACQRVLDTRPDAKAIRRQYEKSNSALTDSSWFVPNNRVTVSGCAMYVRASHSLHM